MRFSVLLPVVLVSGFGLAQACSSNNANSGFAGGDDASTGSSGGGSGSSSGASGSSSGVSGGSSGGQGGDGGSLLGDGSTNVPEASDGSIIVTNTIYANTDTQLYSIDPMNPSTVTLVGTFAGTSDAETDSAVTDCAVDGSGNVWVNTESVIYEATLPTTPPGTVELTKKATVTGSAKFYALAFAPVGAIDPSNETLVGGDSDGALWAIDTTSGATTELGTFGADPMTSGNVFELSGDIVFYLDPTMNMKPTGMATIRSCKSGGSSSTCGDDFLAGIDMTNLQSAYSSKTASSALLSGIYGATSTTDGPGTMFKDVFGLAAWNQSVFGFTRASSSTSNPTPPNLISISTNTSSNPGVGTSISSTFPFSMDGWSGAGVTTKVMITVPTPPPPPPAQ